MRVTDPASYLEKHRRRTAARARAHAARHTSPLMRRRCTLQPGFGAIEHRAVRRRPGRGLDLPTLLLFGALRRGRTRRQERQRATEPVTW